MYRQLEFDFVLDVEIQEVIRRRKQVWAWDIITKVLKEELDKERKPV